METLADFFIHRSGFPLKRNEIEMRFVARAAQGNKSDVLGAAPGFELKSRLNPTVCLDGDIADVGKICPGFIL